MIDGMRVSIIVPTYNRANYIIECLDSLLAQTMPALEIIVIDDGSEDRTAEVLESYGQRIRYVRKENEGKPAAVNLGLSMARGDLIWIFDDDDVALPNAISDRIAVLLFRPEAGFVYGPHYCGTDGDDGKICQGKLHMVREFSPESMFFELMKGCFFHLATTLVRIEVYRSVGGFDTELLSSEDYDMQLRLAHEFPAAFCPEPTFIFRLHSGMRGAKAIRYRGDQRSAIFRQYDRRVGQKLRANLNLGDYLVPRKRQHEIIDHRHALIGRITVMASKGCLSEFFEDLRSLIDLIPEGEHLSLTERQSITAAICIGYAAESIEDNWQEFCRIVILFPKNRVSRAVVRSIASGFFNLAKGYPAPFTLRWWRLMRAAQVALLSLSTK